MNISLPRALENYVRGKVKGGQYASASEFIRECVRDLQSRERESEEIRRKVQEGLDDLDAGRYVTGEEFKAWFRKLHRDRVAKLKRRGA